MNAAPAASPVYRLYNVASQQHLFTIDHNEATTLLGNPVWTMDTPSFAAIPAAGGACPADTEPVDRLVDERTGEHFQTADQHEAAVLTTAPQTFYGEGFAFCAYSTQVSGTIPVFRLWNSVSGQHLWTADTNEVAVLNGNLGWHLESSHGGVAFYAYRA